MTKRQHRVIGGLYRIPLGDCTHAYAQALDEVDFAVFDSRTSFQLEPASIPELPVIFRVAVHKSAWVSGRWEKIGKADIPKHLASSQPTFIQDLLNTDSF